MKLCAVCNKELLIKKGVGGNNKKYCDDCKSEGYRLKGLKCSKNYREAHREKIREYAREYYKNNPDVCRERSKKYYKDNPDACIKRNKQYYKDNRERIIARNKEYRLETRELISNPTKEVIKYQCETQRGVAEEMGLKELASFIKEFKTNQYNEVKGKNEE